MGASLGRTGPRSRQGVSHGWLTTWSGNVAQTPPLGLIHLAVPYDLARTDIPTTRPRWDRDWFAGCRATAAVGRSTWWAVTRSGTEALRRLNSQVNASGLWLRLLQTSETRVVFGVGAARAVSIRRPHRNATQSGTPRNQPASARQRWENTARKCRSGRSWAWRRPHPNLRSGELRAQSAIGRLHLLEHAGERRLARRQHGFSRRQAGSVVHDHGIHAGDMNACGQGLVKERNAVLVETRRRDGQRQPELSGRSACFDQA